MTEPKSKKQTGLSSKIYDYAKDRNDFFCVHEVMDFFNIELAEASNGLSNLSTRGYLTKTDVRKPCKMQTSLHVSYIINKDRIYVYGKKTKKSYNKHERMRRAMDKLSINGMMKEKQKIVMLGEGNKILLSLEFEGEFRINVPPISEPIYSITIEKVKK